MHVFVSLFQHEISDTRQSVSAVSRSKCITSVFAFREGISSWIGCVSRVDVSPRAIRGVDVQRSLWQRATATKKPTWQNLKLGLCFRPALTCATCIDSMDAKQIRTFPPVKTEHLVVFVYLLEATAPFTFGHFTHLYNYTRDAGPHY